jgi:hypothetical protein
VYNSNLTSNKNNLSCYGQMKENYLIEHKQTRRMSSSVPYVLYTSLMCSIIERTDIDRLLVPLFVRCLCRAGGKAVPLLANSQKMIVYSCLTTMTTWESHFKTDDERHQLITYSLCLQNVKDKIGETKHIQEKFFLILISTIYIYIINSYLFIYPIHCLFFPYGCSSARNRTNHLSSIISWLSSSSDSSR